MKKKSGLVKKGDKILKNLHLLGLEYNFETEEFGSNTRGRNANPKKKLKAKSPQQNILNYPTDLEFEKKYSELIKDLKYLSIHENLTIEKLFSVEELKKYYHSIISYLYKGEIKIEQNFSLKECDKGSMHSKLVSNKNYLGKKIKKELKLNTFNIGIFYIESLLQLLLKKRLINNLIITGELKNLHGNKLPIQLEEVETKIKVSKISSNYEKTEFNFGPNRSMDYIKAKNLSPKEIQEAKNLIVSEINFENSSKLKI